jgi:MotA/TolQ/ExbB proton channel family protein
VSAALDMLLLRIQIGGAPLWGILGASLWGWYLAARSAQRLRRGRRDWAAGRASAFRDEAFALARLRLQAGRDLAPYLDHQRSELTRFLPTLAALAAAAPLLGLAGTVTGMIEAFGSRHEAGLGGGPSTLAGGVESALLTTQAGLIFGLPLLMVRFYLDGRARRLLDDLEGDLRRSALVAPAAHAEIAMDGEGLS